MSREPSDTGRLFRSLRADSVEAIPAIGAGQAAKLRTLAAPQTQAAPLVINSSLPAAPIIDVLEASKEQSDIPDADQYGDIDVAEFSGGQPFADHDSLPMPVAAAPIPAMMTLDAVVDAEPETRRSWMPSKRDRSARRDTDRSSQEAVVRSSSQGMTATAAWVMIVVVTMIFGLVDALLFGSGLGWFTGIALLIVTVFAALRVQPADGIIPVLTAPIAFFIADVTVGQLNLGANGATLTNRVVQAFFSLANSWFWIFGAVVAAVVIMIARRRRG